MTTSPYSSAPENKWVSITQILVDRFPLSVDTIVEIVQSAWNDLYSSSFGKGRLRVGNEIFLPAQATGVILEKLISTELEARDPDTWQGGTLKPHKDVLNLKDENFSFEIKTSSSASGLFGNRSTGYRSSGSIKQRTGYYLVINYKLPTPDDTDHHIRKIRFGWIDDDDWVGQKQSSGQQASIGAKLAKLKLITIFNR